MASIARKFEHLLERFRRPDGGMWRGQDIDKATGGVVTRSYVTNLRKGRIENPGYDKLAAIARVMCFSPGLWFEDLEESDPGRLGGAVDSGHAFTDRVNHLFRVLRNDSTGQPYTDGDIARLSFGELTEQQVEDMRTGSVASPSLDQITALAEAFSVHPSYFLNTSQKPPLIDQDTLEVLKDETVTAIAHKSLGLPEREKRTILGIIGQFEEMHETDRDRR